MSSLYPVETAIPGGTTDEAILVAAGAATAASAAAAASSATTAATSATNAAGSASAAAAIGAAIASVDQVVTAAGATAADPSKRTTRYDLATAAGNITSGLANGSVIGQRKSLLLDSISAAKSVVVTPATASGFATVTLSVAKFDGVELEWQAGGWKVVGFSGTPAIA